MDGSIYGKLAITAVVVMAIGDMRIKRDGGDGWFVVCVGIALLFVSLIGMGNPDEIGYFWAYLFLFLGGILISGLLKKK